MEINTGIYSRLSTLILRMCLSIPYTYDIIEESTNSFNNSFKASEDNELILEHPVLTFEFFAERMRLHFSKLLYEPNKEKWKITTINIYRYIDSKYIKSEITCTQKDICCLYSYMSGMSKDDLIYAYDENTVEKIIGSPFSEKEKNEIALLDSLLKDTKEIYYKIEEKEKEKLSYFISHKIKCIRSESRRRCEKNPKLIYLNELNTITMSESTALFKPIDDIINKEENRIKDILNMIKKTEIKDIDSINKGFSEIISKRVSEL